MAELGEQEKNFFAFLATRPDLVPLLADRIPEEIFSADGQTLWRSREFRNEGNASEVDALRFLRSQMLSILGREVGKAQSTGNIDGVRWASELVEQSFDGLQPPPLESYQKIVPEARQVVPTGIQRLDDQIQGLAYGELGVVFMSSGRGKTGVLIAMAVAALRQGLTVHYITVADQGRDEIVPRFDTSILGTSIPVFSDAEVLKRRHKEAIKLVPGKLWISDFTSRECSIKEIEQVIRNCQSDVVFVDHADDVTSPFSADPTVTRHSLRVVYLALKKLAVRFDIPIWTASQSSEMSWYTKAVSIHDLAEAKIGKATGAAIVLGFSGGPWEEQVPGVFYVSICKARRLFTERTFALNFNWALGKVW